jgi:hypothetical protein
MVMLPQGVFEDSFMHNDTISEGGFRRVDFLREKRNSYIESMDDDNGRDKDHSNSSLGSWDVNEESYRLNDKKKRRKPREKKKQPEMGKNWLSMLQSGLASKDTLLLASQADSRKTLAKQLLSTGKSNKRVEDPYEFDKTVIKPQPTGIKISADIVHEINPSSSAHLGQSQAANELLKLHQILQDQMRAVDAIHGKKGSNQASIGSA